MVNLATLLEIVQYRKRSSPKGSIVPREQKDTDSGEIEMFVATVGLKADTQSNDWIVD